MPEQKGTSLEERFAAIDEAKSVEAGRPRKALIGPIIAFDLRYQRAGCIRYALRLRRSPDALLGDEQPRAGRFEVSGVSRRYQIQ